MKKDPRQPVKISTSESKIQQECVTWYTGDYCLKHMENRQMILAILNENHQNMVGVGLLAGAPDLLLTIKNHIVWCEMKKPKGKISPKQRKFEKRVKAMGFIHMYCFTFQEFKEKVLHLYNKLQYTRNSRDYNIDL